jgi:hypothetical protein
VSFPYEVVVASDGTIISLKSIESFKFTNLTSEEATVNKLKDDVSFEFRTVSGKEYTASANSILIFQFDSDKNAAEMKYKERLVNDVYQRWLWLLKP